MTVNKERVQKLVDALRSGDYKQCKLRLRSDDIHFCCLGVACDVYDKENNAMSGWRTNLLGDHYYAIDGFRDSSALPKAVSEWFGFDDNNPKLYRAGSAISANDGKRLDFNQIADLFEQTYLKEN